MKQLGSGILVAIGLVLAGLGLLFLVAAGGQLHRYLVGVAGLGVGGLAIGFGLRAFRRAVESSPAFLRSEILEVARRRNGELSEAELWAAFGTREAGAKKALEALVSDGIARVSGVAPARRLVFPELAPRMVVVRCEHCQAEVRLSAEASECPRCGGVLRTGVERVGLAEDVYRMDE